MRTTRQCESVDKRKSRDRLRFWGNRLAAFAACSVVLRDGILSALRDVGCTRSAKSHRCRAVAYPVAPKRMGPLAMERRRPGCALH